MRHVLAAAALFTGTVLGADLAFAQEVSALGSRDSFVLSLEHLGGYSYTRLEAESAFGGGESEPLDSHNAGLFSPFLGPYGAHARLGFHYLVSPPLSIGALASYSDNDNLGTFMLIGARVGAAIPISASTSIWLRGGFSYAQTTLDFGDNEIKYSAFLPGGEALFVLKPLQHFGFLAGAMFERSVGAKLKSDLSGSGEADYEHMEIALSLGLFLEL
jgi:hypothetical protein